MNLPFARGTREVMLQFLKLVSLHSYYHLSSPCLPFVSGQEGFEEVKRGPAILPG